MGRSVVTVEEEEYGEANRVGEEDDDDDDDDSQVEEDENDDDDYESDDDEADIAVNGDDGDDNYGLGNESEYEDLAAADDDDDGDDDRSQVSEEDDEEVEDPDGGDDSGSEEQADDAESSTDSLGELPWGALKLNSYEEVFEIDCDFTEEEKEDLWFDKDDYNYFLEDCEELAAQITEDYLSEGGNMSLSNDLIGLEAWTKEGYKKRQRMRLGAIDCVLDEQFAQWDDGNEDPDSIAELYIAASEESKLIANTKALRVERDIKDYVQSTEPLSSSSNSSRTEVGDENAQQKKKKEKFRPAKPDGWAAPLTVKQERHRFSNYSGSFRQPGRDLDNDNMRPTDVIPVDEYVIPSKKKKKIAERSAAINAASSTTSSRGVQGSDAVPKKSLQGRKKTPAQLKMMKHPPRKHLPLSGSSNHSLRNNSAHSISKRNGTHPKKHAPKHLPLNRSYMKKQPVNGNSRALSTSQHSTSQAIKKKPQLNTVTVGGNKNALPVKKKKKLPTNPAATVTPSKKSSSRLVIVNRSGPMPASQRKSPSAIASQSSRSMSSIESDDKPKKKKSTAAAAASVPKKKKGPMRRPGSLSSLDSFSTSGDDDDNDEAKKTPKTKLSLVPRMPKLFGKSDRKASIRKTEDENRRLREENERLRIEMENQRLREENERLRKRQQRA